MTTFLDHCSIPSEIKESTNKNGKGITIALEGNANVGKSVIFNHLTGSSQIIGNWPGKTVEMAQGKLHFENYDIDIIDLPGIYSFSTYSIEEIVSREYIAFEKPDVVINVVDASVLERNLYFTLQLKEMEVPLVVCLNQIDMAKKKGIVIDTEKLQVALGVPVVSTVAVKEEGLNELMEVAVEVAKNKNSIKKTSIRYGAEVEDRIEKLSGFIESKQIKSGYPPRWVAIKLLENDPEVKKMIASMSEDVITLSDTISDEIENIYQEPCFSVINSERYSVANRIAGTVQNKTEMKASISEKLDQIVMHRVFGYVISALVLGGLLLWTFFIGNFLSDILSQLFEFFQPVDPQVSGPFLAILWNGAFGGIVAGVTLIIPFVIPFYMMLTIIEDSGILPRIAFMVDSFMHKIGLHGKALIPLILGYGCNVPAIHTTRILETKRERLLAALAITFAPCSARTIVILGLVAVFVSIEWALALYIIDIMIIFVVGRIAFKTLPGETTGLIMEMHSFRVPSISVVSKQTWVRTKSIIYLVFPIYIVGSAAVQGLYVYDILDPISNFMSPLTVGWLGLPAVAGILLIFGVVRKEYILLLLVAIYGTQLSSVFTPVQFIVLALVGMLYIPCISTITIMAKEFGWKSAAMISLANFFTAIIFGGIFYRLLSVII
jgi:ferrous iron transport protein B